MTKRELERENKFLRLELKIIADLLKEAFDKQDIERLECIAAAKYYAENYQNNLDFINENDLEYNFYNKTMSI